MIRNRTWRSAAVAAVLGADLVVLLVAGSVLPGFVPFALGALLLATLWALRPALRLGRVRARRRAGARRRRAGIGPRPRSLEWAFTAAAAAAVVADPPRPDDARVVAASGGPPPRDGAALGGAGGRPRLGRHRRSRAWERSRAATPMAWAPWLGAVALGLVAAVVWQVRVATRRS